MKLPIGIKINEWVNWRWYSRNNNGSVSDLIKMSISGARPARNPMMLAIIILFFFEYVWAAVVATIPCVSGSVLFIFYYSFFAILVNQYTCQLMIY